MRRGLFVLMICTTTLGGCSTLAKLNPFSWFKKSQQETVVPLDTRDPADKRDFAAQVLDLRVEPYPGGAIVRATGLPPTQGWWKAELKPLPIDENGVLVLEFRVFPPEGTAGVVNQQSREIVAAYALSDIRLEKISKIVVQGKGNALSTAR